VGGWFLMSLPRDLRMVFMGGSPLASALLGFGMLGALASILMMGRAMKGQNIRLAAIGVTGLTVMIVATMCVMRDILRDAYLKPYLHAQDFAVKTQWSPFLLFLGLFVAGVVFWFVMLQRFGLFAVTKPANH